MSDCCFCSKQKFLGNLISTFYSENYLHSWTLIAISRALDWCQILYDSSSDFQLVPHLSSPGSKFQLTIDTKLCHEFQYKWHQSIDFCSESKNNLLLGQGNWRCTLKLWIWKHGMNSIRIVDIFRLYFRTLFESAAKPNTDASVTRYWRSGDNRLIVLYYIPPILFYFGIYYNTLAMK